MKNFNTVEFALENIIIYCIVSMMFIMSWSYAISKSKSPSIMTRYILKHGDFWGKIAMVISWLQNTWNIVFPIAVLVKFILITKES